MALNRRGQTTTEYILLLAIIAAGVFATIRGLKAMKLTASLTAPLTQDFVMAYHYGNPKAKGPDEGGYQNHPRANGFLFFNPGN